MQTLVIDTNGIVKKLEQRGFSRTQAEGIVAARLTPLLKYLFAPMSAQTALIVGLLQLLK